VPLASGELLYVTDDQRLYIGNGTTLGGVQVTGYNDEDSQEATAQLFLGTSPVLAPDNTNHIGISFVYDDNANRISATVDFSTVNTLVADAFQGSVFADDSTLLVNAVDGTFNLNGTIKGNIVPNVSEAYDIGTPSAKFKDLYLSGSSLFLGDASITASGSAINLPVGSTVGGVEIGLATESIVRDLVGSVIGEDSTILVDATSNSIFGNTIVGNTIETDGIRLEGTILSTNGSALEITPNLDVFTQIPVNFNILAAGTESSIADAEFQAIDIRAFKGSIGSPVDIESGDVLGTLSFSGFSVTSGLEIGCLIGAQCDPNGDTEDGAYIPTKFFVVNQAAAGLGEDPPFLTFDSFGRLAVNQENAQATLDVNGDAIIRGGLRADLTGSLFSDASTMIFDGTDGKLMTANINLIGETGNTPANAVTVDSWLEVTVNGVTKYIPLYD
jgi:hypothetical protein